jgi:cbb3-type cytochrome oxidase cytochrome c subunit
MRLTAPAVLIAFALAVSAGCAGQGRRIFVREGCVNCHRFKDLGIESGTSLDGVGSRRDAASIRAKIRNPVDGPGSRMPAFDHLSWLDLSSLAAFLRS